MSSCFAHIFLYSIRTVANGALYFPFDPLNGHIRRILTGRFDKYTSLLKWSARISAAVSSCILGLGFIPTGITMWYVDCFAISAPTIAYLPPFGQAAADPVSWFGTE